jgi:uncharacterized protein (TIGR01244 family)
MLEDIYNYLRLTDLISTSGQPSEAQIAEIVQAGFLVVINLALSGTDYALEDEAATVQANGMDYIHIPVIWDHPTLADLEAFIQAMDAHQGDKIFVHCAANMRVSAFMALYRIKRLGWEPEKAFEEVKRIWTPNETWQAFIEQTLRMET